MGHEISQFDIPDRQLLDTNAQPRVSLKSDIGEAKVTRTIFGRAKVRVVRERDKKLRAWLLTVLATLALAAAGWQGWIVFQQMQNAAPQLSLSERIRVSAPVFQPEDIGTSTVRSKEKTQTELVIDSLSTRREPAPQPRQEPVPQPRRESAPQASISLKASDKMIAKPLAPIQPAPTNIVTPPVTQPEVSRPVAVTPSAAPVIKETNPTPLPASNNQPSGSAN